MTQDLEPIAPQRAVDLSLAQREDGASDRTVQAHRYRLKHFVRWCGQEDLTNLNDLTGRRLYEYRLWRKDDGDLNPVSLRTQLSTLRAFVRFRESIDAVESGMHEEIEPASSTASGTSTERDSACGEGVMRDDRLHQRQIWPSSHNCTTGARATSSCWTSVSEPLVGCVRSGTRYTPLTEPRMGDNHAEGLSNKQRHPRRKVRRERLGERFQQVKTT